ncbi:hypothetical protein FNL56_09695 [Tardiphaga sp. vice304]|uniref:hypothetical protein n=1 Tax=unclassified Tardiphaga TaxID=2631404 RepID=UPI001162D1FE|nr:MULTISPECIES: hypothetical protein [unclassified Tardiphaga]QDM16123.1 hypothetical protein FNL53_09560 [Tardiphaga sp. vice278]QDM26328.1 hypothetical protein FNL56_09695 [Tardiphaga sp. vice304]
MTRRWVTGVVAMLVGLGGVVLYFGAGAYDMGADAPHWDVTRRAIEIVRDRSIAAHTKDIELPGLEDKQLVSKGAGQYVFRRGVWTPIGAGVTVPTSTKSRL